MMKVNLLFAVLLLLCFRCPDKDNTRNKLQATSDTTAEVLTGADQLSSFVPELEGKRVALVANNTAMVGPTHLADTLKRLGVNLVKIFAPEHGFRGRIQNGDYVRDELDRELQIPVVSLYGSNKKPSAQQLADVDVLIFDIQDVGVRFFTYISTLHYLMEACADNNKQLLILDRPNPNGNYVDGTVLKPAFKSFVGMHPIPVVHGLTIGEVALMVNGEGWLGENKKCDLKVIPVKNWNYDDFYSLPVKPSPNLPDDQSVILYPSVCFLEGTVISVGRGTQTPFQVIGHPDLKDMPYQFTPVSIEGMSTTPPHKDKVCHGVDLRNIKAERKLTLKYLIDMYRAYPDKDKFFNPLFDKLAGTSELREQIISGYTEEQIRATWKEDLDKYLVMRKKYLLYD